MRPISRIFGLLVILLATFANHSRGQDQIAEIQGLRSALATGDAGKLVEMVDGSLELALFGSSQKFSKVQAELVLRKFFADNRPRAFDIVDFEPSDLGLYVEGRLHLTEEDRRVRTYLRLKKTKNGWMLRELLMERSDG